MADDTIILWEGVPITDLSREKLYEVIRHLMTEQQHWVDQTMALRSIDHRHRMDWMG